MKNVLKPVLIITLFTLSLAFAGMQVNELLFVPWGEANNEVRHESYPGLHTGPLSFQVQNNGIIIFDTENKELKTFYGNGSMVSEKLSDSYVVDFYKDQDKLYLLQPQTIYVKENNTRTLISHLDDPKDMFSGLKNKNGRIEAFHQRGKVQCTPPTLNKGQVSDISVTRTLPSSLNVMIGSNAYTLNVPDIGSVDYIGSTPENDHYIYAETITSHVPLTVQRMILFINNEEDVLSTLHLPQQQFTYIFKEFTVGEHGELYHMQSSKDGIHILEWTPVDNDEADTYYPEAFRESYHFNQFVEAEPVSEEVPSLSKTAAVDVTRGEALVIGDEYVTHTWTATASNIGTTSTVTTPSWIVVGQNQRVPYKWGGWSTVAQFDEGIAAGKLAGDIYTEVVDWGNSVGADCSGFVSVCWKTSQKYGTSTFSQVSSQLSSYNDLLPADATNNAGSHIRMVVEWTTDGKLVQIEETSSGTPGWAARYYTWRLSDITAYVPIRYNYIQNSLAPRPTLLSVTTSPDSVTLKWSTDESTIFNGYRIYRKTIGQDYSVVAEILKGLQTVTIYQPDEIAYDYFVAAYIASDSANYNASDVYAAKNSDNTESILIVDGFDRFSGSYSSPTHSIVANTAFAMDHWGVNYESCANDAVINGSVDLKDYDMVWWICGDESTADETFNNIEQDSVESYLEQGGRFFVSGSEIAWDLDNKGTASDKAFFHDYLKANYAFDDAENYIITGASSTVFEDITLSYSSTGNEDNTYAEDYPDAFNASGGSQTALSYGNGRIAALAYSGNFPNGTSEGKVMIMGFPFETIITYEEKDSLAGAILDYMGMNTTTGISPLVPQTATLHQNYPNPFNPLTTIGYRLDKPALVNIKIYDLRGELVQNIAQGYRNAGEYEVIFDGTNLASGMYVYGLELNGTLHVSKKMTVLK